MEEKKVLKLLIFEKVYTVSTDENEDGLNQAAKKVDELMKDISSKTRFGSESKLAVLAALQLAFDLTKRQIQDEYINSKVEDLNSLLDEVLTG